MRSETRGPGQRPSRRPAAWQRGSGSAPGPRPDSRSVNAWGIVGPVNLLQHAGSAQRQRQGNTTTRVAFAAAALASLWAAQAHAALPFGALEFTERTGIAAGHETIYNWLRFTLDAGSVPLDFGSNPLTGVDAADLPAQGRYSSFDTRQWVPAEFVGCTGAYDLGHIDFPHLPQRLLEKPLEELALLTQQGFDGDDGRFKLGSGGHDSDAPAGAGPSRQSTSCQDRQPLASGCAHKSGHWLGHREFDAQDVGVTWAEGKGLSQVDTSKPGNGNQGHEFRDAAPGTPGVIGPLLKTDERRAIIEYLKTL